MEQIEIILPKQKCLEQALSLRVGVTAVACNATTGDTAAFE